MARKRRACGPKSGNPANSRLSANVISFIVTCGLLFLSVSIADGNFTQRINNISKNLDSSLKAMLDLEQVNYTDWTSNATYYSDTSFNARGMAGLYNLTTAFIAAVVPEQIFPDGLVYVQHGRLQFDVSDLGEIANYYKKPLALVIVLIVVAVLTSFCGLCFCCCRCCGKCGARSKPIDKKGDCCKKFFLATSLIILGTMLLFGVVCAFVGNQHMYEGTNELASNLNTSVKDTKTYLESTRQQVKTLFSVNYGEFEETTFRILNATAETVYRELESYSNAVSVTEVSNIVNTLPDVIKNLEVLKNSTNDIRVNASQLNDALRKVKRDLLLTLKNCAMVTECQTLQDKYVNTLSSDIDFDSLPDVGTQIDELGGLLTQDLVDAINSGQKKLEEIQEEISNAVTIKLADVRNTIKNAGYEIQNQSQNIDHVFTNFTAKINDVSDGALNTMDTNVKKYSPYVYYFGIGVSSVLLFVTFCVALGLICGICGKRPDKYGDDCCSKGVGSRFLMCGIFMMFFSAVFLAVITIAYFAVGIVVQRSVCDTLRHSNDSQIVELVDDLVDFKELAGIDVSVRTILHNCHKNESMYNVFNLTGIFDVNELDDYLSQYNITSSLNGLIDQITVETNITILDESAKEKLEKLSTSGISDLNFDKFGEVLENDFTTHNLNELVEQLEKLIVAVEKYPEAAAAVVGDLKLSIFHIESYQSRLVEPMIAGATEMKTIAQNLSEQIKFNKDSFSEAINSLIKEVEATESYLQKNGTEALKNIAKGFVTGVENHVQTFLNRISSITLNDLGKCGPLSRVINATLVSTCDKILLPLNGFWFGVFWSVLLFVPTLIVSVQLSILYQKYNPYHGHLMDTEYLYDAYTDRENIPLNSRNGKPGKKKQKKKKRDDRAVAVPLSDQDIPPASYPMGSQAADARYADMAPKHWEEFPANGPPQYQRAPTEYERPPPYYYPGTTEQQR